MTHFSFDIVGFDLDGTLVDTSGDLADAVNAALRMAGRPMLRIDQVAGMVGGGARHLLEQALAATGGKVEAFDPLYRHMLEHYAGHIAVHSRPYPGAVEALDRLTARGVRLAVVTNKLEALAHDLLTALGLRDRFAALIGGDTMGVAKPDPAGLHEMVRRCGGGRAAFVGDSRYDIMAAKAAALPNVAVAFGLPKDLGADAVITAFTDLVPTLERLG